MPQWSQVLQYPVEKRTLKMLIAQPVAQMSGTKRNVGLYFTRYQAEVSKIQCKQRLWLHQRLQGVIRVVLVRCTRLQKAPYKRSILHAT